jgi:acetyl esterase/lipase
LRRVASVFLGVCAIVSLQVPRPASALVPSTDLPPANEATLTYCSPGGTPLAMDLYRPLGLGYVPVVVFVHGGGWIAGDRQLGVSSSYVAGYLNSGLAFATIDYRLGDGRAALEDVACAVRFLRANALRLGLRADRIGAVGQSAGGQLVSMLGTVPRSAGFDVGENLGVSSRVQAVVDEWGPVIFDATELNILNWIPDVFGTSDLTALKVYSPLTYATPDDPPFLIVQGAQDLWVPAHQSIDFAHALDAAGVSEDEILVQHAGHALNPWNGMPTPSLTAVQGSVLSFFATTLRG